MVQQAYLLLAADAIETALVKICSLVLVEADSTLGTQQQFLISIIIIIMF